MKSPEILRIGGAEFDPGSNRVRAPDGHETTLRRQSALVLRALVARRGRNVSKGELFGEVWPDVAVTDDSLVQCVRDIRLALGSARSALVTVARDGYRLEAEVGVVGTDLPLEAASPSRAWMSAAAMVAVVVLTGAALAWRDTSAPAAQAVAPFEGPVVAVLPVRNLSVGERWDRLAGGLTEDIIADLAQNPWLYVLAGSATADYAEAAPGEMAKALGVDHVVTATLQAEEGRVSLLASLTQADTGRQVWSRRWEGAEDELLTFQRDVAEALTGELASTWSGALATSDLARAQGRDTADLTAYDLALLASEKIFSNDVPQIEEGILLLQQAVEQDPGFGDAWALLAYAYLAALVPDMPPDKERRYWELSDAAALEALRVSPDLPKPLVTAAYVYERQGNDAEAQRLIRRAAAAAPNNAEMLAYAANRALHQPELAPEMLDWIERALRLNPESPGWYEMSLGFVLFALGRHDEATDAFLRAPDFVDRHSMAAAALALVGRTDEARASYALAAATPGYSIEWQLEVFDPDPAMAALVEKGLRLAQAADVAAP